MPDPPARVSIPCVINAFAKNYETKPIRPVGSPPRFRFAYNVELATLSSEAPRSRSAKEHVKHAADIS